MCDDDEVDVRMFVANGVARLGGWLDWVAITLRLTLPRHVHLVTTRQP